MTTTPATSRRELHEQYVRTYFQGCNDADAAKMISAFHESVVHYFPPGMFGPVTGGKAIADLWIEMVRRLGSRWTIDRLVSDDDEVVVEWTHFQPKAGTWIRGAEWYEFADDGRITAIKAYYASPRDMTLAHNELAGYPYDDLGYPVGPPDLAPSLD
jgi:SnoaL-like domain